MTGYPLFREPQIFYLFILLNAAATENLYSVFILYPNSSLSIPREVVVPCVNYLAGFRTFTSSTAGNSQSNFLALPFTFSEEGEYNVYSVKPTCI